MPATDSSHRPYVSRRKRRRFSEAVPLFSNRSMLGLLGLLVLGLIVSLGIIAVQMAEPELTSQQYSAAPATTVVGQ